jgi:hypothetical protein
MLRLAQYHKHMTLTSSVLFHLERPESPKSEGIIQRQPSGFQIFAFRAIAGDGMVGGGPAAEQESGGARSAADAPFVDGISGLPRGQEDEPHEFGFG